jgi:Flp pilus assembly protein TadD
VSALVQASLACAALERVADAEERAREALGSAERMQRVDEAVHWALGRAALVSGNADRAVSELRRAQQFMNDDNRRQRHWVPIALDLALAHEALGQLGEARAVALRARELDTEPENAAAHRALGALLARAGPYR